MSFGGMQDGVQRGSCQEGIGQSASGGSPAQALVSRNRYFFISRLTDGIIVPWTFPTMSVPPLGPWFALIDTTARYRRGRG